MRSFRDLREKTLTPAEKKKREEIAKAMERDNPDMDMGKKMAIATAQAKKVAEAKDPNEYDKEGEMMKGQLRQICSANEKLMTMVGDDDNLPEWVQNKVTKATDYIRSVRDYLESENNKDDMSEASKSNMLCKECGDQFGKPTNEKCMYDAYDQLGENWVTKEMYEGLDITEISLDQLTKKITQTNINPVIKKNVPKLKKDLADVRARLNGEKPSLAKESVDEAQRRKGAPKMTGDSFAMQRAKDAEHNKAMGRTKTGRKTPTRTMTSTQRSLASLRNEEVEQIDELTSAEKKLIGQMYDKKGNLTPLGKKVMDHGKAQTEDIMSADKKPEKYIKPDGKVGIRMVRVDKHVVSKDA